MMTKHSLLLTFISFFGLASAWADDFNLAGHWISITKISDGEDRRAELTFTQKDGEWSGKVQTDFWDEARMMEGVSLKEGKLSCSLGMEYDGLDLVYRVEADVRDADRLQGIWTATGADGAALATGTWVAERKVEKVNPLIGEWTASTPGPDDTELKMTAVFAEEDRQLSGQLKTSFGDIALKSVSLEGDQVILKLPFPYEDEVYSVTVTATLEGDVMSGRWVAFNAKGDEEATASWKALRAGTADLAGSWSVTATLSEDNEMKAIYAFEKDGDDWTGKLVSDSGELEFDGVKLEGKDLVIDMELPYEGSSIEVRVKAAFSGADGLVGKWMAFDDSGQESGTGDWKAARKAD